MQLNLEDLRKHYASLNDDALLEIERADLMKPAQECYDAELHRRGLRYQQKSGPGEKDSAKEAEPDWLAEAACAVSFEVHPGGDALIQIDAARDVLEAAEIPCHVVERPPERDDAPPSPIIELRVPGALTLKAMSVLDRDYYNPQTEEEWRAHFAALSDEDFQLLELPTLTAGLLDRIERLTNAYNEELALRRKPRPTGW